MAELNNTPLVGVIMGSSSDWDVMQHAVTILKQFGVPFEAQVISAHRMPDEMVAYAKSARARGLRHHRRCRRRGPPAGHGGRDDHRAGSGRAGAVEVSARRGFAAVH